MLWDGSEVVKSSYENQTHSRKGKIKFMHFKLSRLILLSLYYITLVSRLLSIKKEQKIRTCTLEYPWISVIWFLKKKRNTKTNEVDFHWAKGGERLSQGQNLHQWQQYSVLTIWYILSLETSILKHICSIYELGFF